MSRKRKQCDTLLVQTDCTGWLDSLAVAGHVDAYYSAGGVTDRVRNLKRVAGLPYETHPANTAAALVWTAKVVEKVQSQVGDDVRPLRVGVYWKC